MDCILLLIEDALLLSPLLMVACRPVVVVDFDFGEYVDVVTSEANDARFRASPDKAIATTDEAREEGLIALMLGDRLIGSIG